MIAEHGNSRCMVSCSKCFAVLSEDDFYRAPANKSGRFSWCKRCHNFLTKKRAEALPEVRQKKMQAARDWRKKNKQRKAALDKKWRENNRQRARFLRQRAAKNPVTKAATNIRRRIRGLLKGIRIESTQALVGCSRQQFVKHIESQFKDGMRWDNYGLWHLDHIVPISAFNLADEQQRRIANNWQNIRPLWAKDNIAKSDKNTSPQVFLPLAI